jgi:hypothetical protein
MGLATLDNTFGGEMVRLHSPLPVCGCQREGEGLLRHYGQQYLWLGLLLCTTLVVPSCTYETAVRRLSPPEQAELRLYRHVMTGAHIRTYLAQATAAERTAYLHTIGLAQRFQALDPADQEAVRSGFPRRGMSAEALRFVWGEPYYTAGHAQHAAHWFYLGSSLGLATSGNQYGRIGQQVDVYLVDGRVVGWVDYAPSTEEQDNDWGGH